MGSAGDLLRAIGEGISGLVAGSLAAIGSGIGAIVGVLQAALPGPLFPIVIVGGLVLFVWLVLRR
jgi:hypothetical protein